MGQQDGSENKSTCCQSYNLSSTAGTHMRGLQEKTDFYKLSSDFHMQPYTQVHM